MPTGDQWRRYLDGLCEDDTAAPQVTAGCTCRVGPMFVWVLTRARRAIDPLEVVYFDRAAGRCMALLPERCAETE